MVLFMIAKNSAYLNIIHAPLNLQGVKLAYMKNHTFTDRAGVLLTYLKGQGIKPSTVAKKLGVNAATITQWKNGSTQSINGELAMAMKKHFGISAEWLLMGIGPMLQADLEAEITERVLKARLERHELLDISRLPPSRRDLIIKTAEALMSD
jgi:plasmid maintenance system antidote protein VapI